jgi:hypothetical protein
MMTQDPWTIFNAILNDITQEGLDELGMNVADLPAFNAKHKHLMINTTPELETEYKSRFIAEVAAHPLATAEVVKIAKFAMDNFSARLKH